MTRPSRSKGIVKRGEGVTKRKLDLDNEAQKVVDPLAGVGRTQLVGIIADLQNQIMAMHQELTVQHAKANQALRMLGALYNFMFGITFSYIQALQNFKDAGNDKPLPAFWLAARVCDTFETFFEKFDLKKLDIGPDAALLINVYKMANRPLNPGSTIGDYVGFKAPAPKEENKSPDGEDIERNPDGTAL